MASKHAGNNYQVAILWSLSCSYPCESHDWFLIQLLKYLHEERSMEIACMHTDMLSRPASFEHHSDRKQHMLHAHRATNWALLEKRTGQVQTVLQIPQFYIPWVSDVEKQGLIWTFLSQHFNKACNRKTSHSTATYSFCATKIPATPSSSPRKYSMAERMIKWQQASFQVRKSCAKAHSAELHGDES